MAGDSQRDSNQNLKKKRRLSVVQEGELIARYSQAGMRGDSPVEDSCKGKVIEACSEDLCCFHRTQLCDASTRLWCFSVNRYSGR